MTHPAFGILEETLRSKSTESVIDLLKKEVWGLPIWVLGTRTNHADGKIAFQFSLQAQEEGLPVLLTHFDEAQARQAAEVAGEADRYLSLDFCHLVLIAESQRFNAELVDGGAVFMLEHQDILTLRDLVRIGGEGIPMSEAEALTMTLAVRNFAAQAYDHCARQPEVRSLHLAVLMMPGVTPSVICMLNASQGAKHTEALQELSRTLFRPGWRLDFCDPLDPTELHELLKSLGPWYALEHPKGWWARFKRGFNPPVVPLIDLKITDA